MKVSINTSSLLFLHSANHSSESPNLLSLAHEEGYCSTLPKTPVKIRKSFDVQSSLSILNHSSRSLKRSHSHNKTQGIFSSHNFNEVRQEYSDIVSLRAMNAFEKIDVYTDEFPVLDVRKGLFRIKTAASEICVRMVTNSYFEMFILVVILANIITLALEGTNVTLSGPLGYLELFYLLVYSIEAALKITAYGFLMPKGSYLRDVWNYIDLAVIVSGWVDYISNSSINLTAIRTLRILRPLRGITSVKGLRVIVLALISSYKHLIASISLLLIYLLIFAIAGLQIWSGSLRFTCMDLPTGVISDTNCGSNACGESSVCVYGLNNPNFGATNFDNLLYSFLTVFQCITLEGWTDTMLYIEQTYNRSATLYFVCLVFIGAYLLVSLTLVVIKASLTNSIQVHKKKDTDQQIEIIDTNTLADYFKKVYTEPEDSDGAVASASDEELGLKFTSRSLNGEQVAASYTRTISDTQILKRFQTNPIESSAEISLKKKLCKSSPTAATKDLGVEQFSKSVPSSPTKMKSDKTPKFLSLHTVTPMITRMNSSIKISKDLMKNIESDGDLVPMIHQAPLHNSSCLDVVPIKYGKTFTSATQYTFSYRTNKETDFFSLYIAEKERKSAEFAKKTPEHRTDLRRMHYYGRLYGKKAAFFKYNIKVYKVVGILKELDHNLLEVVGEWTIVNPEHPSSPQTISLSTMTYRIWKAGCLGVFERHVAPIESLLNSKFFNYTIYTCIIINIIVLSMDHYRISTEMQSTLSSINTVFTFIFLLEILMKIVSTGIRKLSRDIMNYLDIAIVLSSIIEFVFLAGGKSTITAFRALRIFKLIRVTRVARLFRYLNSMNHIIVVMSRSMSKFAYVALLLFLFIVVYSLLGIQLFAGNLNENRQSRSNFDNFYWAFLAIFQVLSIENWQNLLYDTMNSSVGPGSAVFLVSWVFLGNFILLNLFLAILLDAFTNNDEDEEEVEEKPVDSMPVQAMRRRSSLLGDVVEKNKQKRLQTMKIIEDLPEINSDSEVSLPSYLKDLHRFDGIECEKSFLVFKKSSKLRILCNKISRHKKFETTVLILIIISSLKLVIETYTFKNSTASSVLGYIDIVLTLLFFCEFLVKAINTGFIYNKGSYLSDHWNVIDFIIITISVIDLLLTSISIKYIKIFRLLRTLRPLRFISHNISMKIVVVSLLQSIVAILNVVVVCLIIWIMFAILGVNLFGGKLYRCANETIKTLKECEAGGFEWKVLFPNYDNLINAMIALFIVSSEEGWPDIMFNAIDATDIGKAQVQDYNPLAGIYFVCFVFIGSFFFMNLFIGVVFEQFNEVKKHQGSFAAIVLSKEQMLWVELQQLIAVSVPHADFVIPSSTIRRVCYIITKHSYFESFIFICILLNMCQMAIIYNEASASYLNAIDTINLGFTAIFITEAIMKLIGNGVVRYFKANWNKFDFLVALSSLLDILLTYVAASSIDLLRSGPQLIKTIKLIRISRLFRLFRSLKPLQTLLTIMAYSLPAIFNVLSLMLLIFFIYAVMGVYLFSDITTGKIVNSYVNFSDFGMAMLTLFRSATGENWYLIMYDCSANIGSIAAYFYFCSFITISSFILLNLFIMVILQNYDDYQSNPNSVFKIFNKDIKRFKRAWGQYAQDYGYRVSYKLLPEIMLELNEKFGISKDIERHKLYQLLSVMELPIEDNKYVHYNDFLFALMKRKYAGKAQTKNNKHAKKILAKEHVSTIKKLNGIREKFYENPTKKEDKNPRNKGENFFIGMLYVKTIFRSWKNWAMNRKYIKEYETELSITPRMTEEEFPGEVSEVEGFILSRKSSERSF